MRKNIVAIVLATFVGVFCALQLDHFVSQNRGHIPFISGSSNSDNLFQTAYSGPTLSPAPFDFTAAAKKVSPSVVSVDRYDDVQVGFFDDQVAREQSGTGSGVIISDSGYIVTNNHVVSGAKRVRVRLNDNSAYDAKVLGTDPRSDLAVIQIPDKNLQPAEIGTSKNVQVGQWVLAVGNPLGFDNTVSVGVVSSMKRNLPIGDQGMVDAIQTDAAINPGNSGGALCNSQGQLIGINAAIASGNGGSVGIGFAIPVDRVKEVVNDIVKYGYAKYAGLGIGHQVNYDQALADPDFRAQVAQQANGQDVPDHGILVMSADNAAAQAGIRKFDVIEAVDDQPIQGSFDLNKVLIPKKPGDSVKVKFWHSGKEVTKTVVLEEIHESTQPLP